MKDEKYSFDDVLELAKSGDVVLVLINDKWYSFVEVEVDVNNRELIIVTDKEGTEYTFAIENISKLELA